VYKSGFNKNVVVDHVSPFSIAAVAVDIAATIATIGFNNQKLANRHRRHNIVDMAATVRTTGQPPKNL
jgi:hypothetical protein